MILSEFSRARSKGLTPSGVLTDVLAQGVRPRVCLGPPGTGKTRTLVAAVLAEIQSGVHPDRIGFVTFTRAAKQEMVERLASGDPPISAPKWMRTIHSACFRLLKDSWEEPNLRERLLTNKRWQEFSARYGYEISIEWGCTEALDDAAVPPPQRARHDILRYVYEWGRARRISTLAASQLCSVERLSVPDLMSFERDLLAFKGEHDCLDFSDLLEACLDGELTPKLDVLFIDEAQDLSPLQIAVVESWMVGCKRIYVAGDDDQAIYTFQGADAGWLQDLASLVEPEILAQSHRVPVRAHVLADRIVQQNRERHPKRYFPTAKFGSVEYLDLDAALARVDGSVGTFVLVRNRRSIARIARYFLDRGLPYVVEGGGALSPLSDARLLHALRTAIRLGRHTAEAFAAGDVQVLASFIPTGEPLMPRGVKKRLSEASAAQRAFTLAEVRNDLRLAGLVAEIRRKGPASVLKKLSGEMRGYLERIVGRTSGLPSVNVIVTTIHGAKGREKDLVVIVPEMTKATWRAYARGTPTDREAENRVFYVGVTRTLNRLILVQPRSRRAFDMPVVNFEEGTP